VRRLIAFTVLSLLVAACGEQGVMDGLGERSHAYVAGSTTTTIVRAVLPSDTNPAGVTPIENVRWFNEGIEGEQTGEANVVISTVWARGAAGERFIQASPAEIASALPNIDFPSVVPDETTWITSQLVYDVASATLDIETAAAFGLWSVRPYTVDEGRLGVLRVGIVSGQQTVEPGGGIISAVVEEGLNLAWSDGIYTYELFCRQEIPEDLCWQMVESVIPLSIAAPGPVEPATEG
jgi:hypothetical protein